MFGFGSITLVALLLGGGNAYADVDEDIASVVCTEAYRWPCAWAVAVVKCESGGIPWIVDPSGTYVGYWQVTHGSPDPYINTQQAYKQFMEWVRGERSVSPWPNCPRRY